MKLKRLRQLFITFEFFRQEAEEIYEQRRLDEAAANEEEAALAAEPSADAAAAE